MRVVRAASCQEEGLYPLLPFPPLLHVLILPLWVSRDRHQPACVLRGGRETRRQDDAVSSRTRVTQQLLTALRFNLRSKPVIIQQSVLIQDHSSADTTADPRLACEYCVLFVCWGFVVCSPWCLCRSVCDNTLSHDVLLLP